MKCHYRHRGPCFPPSRPTGWLAMVVRGQPLTQTWAQPWRSRVPESDPLCLSLLTCTKTPHSGITTARPIATISALTDPACQGALPSKIYSKRTTFKEQNSLSGRAAHLSSSGRCTQPDNPLTTLPRGNKGNRIPRNDPNVTR